MGKEPDIMVSMGEAAINRAMAASFYANQNIGLIALLSQSFQLDSPDRGLRLIDPPLIITIGRDVLLTTFGTEAWARLFGVQVEADISASARLRSWIAEGKVFIEIQDMDLNTVSLAGRMKIPGFAVSMAEGVMRGIMSHPMTGPAMRGSALPSIVIPPMAPGTIAQDVYITSFSVSEGRLS